MNRLLSLVLATGIACAPPTQEGTELDGSQVGDDGDEAVCRDVWSPVTDLEAVPEGLAFSPRDLIALSVGEFEGELDRDSGAVADAVLTVTSGERAWLNRPEAVSESVLCASGPLLEVLVDYTLVVEDLLDVAGTECAWATLPERMMVSQRVGEDQVGGSLAPGWGDAWPDVQLSLSWHRDEDEFTGHLMWEGTSAEDPSGQGESIGTLSFDAD